MPLWSNEEWRARIGSCWCALGRPFKTDKSSGSYPSCALSGRAIQAVYVLMALILVQGLKSINECVIGCRRQLKSELQTIDSFMTISRWQVIRKSSILCAVWNGYVELCTCWWCWWRWYLYKELKALMDVSLSVRDTIKVSYQYRFSLVLNIVCDTRGMKW